MSYHVYFALSTGFTRPQRVPKGTLKGLLDGIQAVEKLLGLKRIPTYTPEGEPQQPGWSWRNAAADMLAHAGPKADTSLPQWWLADRERDARISRMGATVRNHNADVRAFYQDLGVWQKRKWKRGESETITPAQAVEFWGGLQILELPRKLWDEDHFRAYMEHLHTLLTRGSSDGVELDCPPFNPSQAGAILELLEAEIDEWGYDMRFAIPLDADLQPYDCIASSVDGGYDWCSKCGPIHSNDFRARCRVCPNAKTGKCDLKNSHPAEFEDEDED